ncbi:RbsD/FucU family protein [Kurthia sibirica]|uniref:Fucose isomerase n=1 Tax=Kurthia sibirica TaxID=202750 RepID=A0A2U3AJZ3_9BACL|nr:RbsD/FucU domain-containing protein [Kurthia sibirica]PWI24860.1 fucose isomerase [Kurthia sibirica]GEK35204.1 fucose isomerase [Kurthia sibirica]
MLKNIPSILSPALLKLLMEMGHGDQIVIADANFPAASLARNLVRADGHGSEALLAAILQLMPIDTYSEKSVLFMQHGKEVATPRIWDKYEQIIQDANEPLSIGHIPRFDFYNLAKTCYAIVATGEEQLYANIILTKGVLQGGL